MDKELLYNQSGIKDETAYKAITNLRSGGGSAYMNGYEINKGEIWEAKDNNYGTRLVVVLCCYEKYAATVMLQDQEPGSNAVPVRARDIMYADAGRLGWTFYDKMLDFVRALTAEEEAELRRTIAEALELREADLAVPVSVIQEYENATAIAEAEVRKLQQQLKDKTAEAEEAYEHMEANAARVDELEDLVIALRKQLKEATETPAKALKEVIDVREDLAAARKEAEIYKGLYEQLLARALG